MEQTELGCLPHNFYVTIADYLRLLGEESRMLDKKTLKAKLLEQEAKHVRCMLDKLVWTRFEKITCLIGKSQSVSSEALTAEEIGVFEGFVPITEAFSKFAKELLQGQVARVEAQKTHKRTVLRFVKVVPAIIGVDMKSYGPFLIEDVASVPIDNAQILVKQGLAVLVEPS
jgi:DNA replication initiation complex subunit (GINS family)